MPAPTDNEHGQGDSSLLAAKLDHLFNTKLRPVTDREHKRDVAAAGDDKPIERRQRLWQEAEVAAKVGATPAYINMLRKGTRPNPGILLVHKLADVFDVPMAYLGDDSIPVVAPDQLAVLHQKSGHPALALANRLNTLFATVRPPGSKDEYTNAEVAEYLVNELSVGATADEIRALRDGTASDVGMNLIRGLAQFFGVPFVYLVAGDGDEKVADVDRQLAEYREYRKSGTFRIAARAGGLSGENLATVEKMIDAFLQAQKSDPANEP